MNGLYSPIPLIPLSFSPINILLKLLQAKVSAQASPPSGDVFNLFFISSLDSILSCPKELYPYFTLLICCNKVSLKTICPSSLINSLKSPHISALLLKYFVEFCALLPNCTNSRISLGNNSHRRS